MVNIAPTKHGFPAAHCNVSMKNEFYSALLIHNVLFCRDATKYSDQPRYLNPSQVKWTGMMGRL